MSGENGSEPVVYRFADVDASETFDVPGCHCPAGTHKKETVTIRTQLGEGDRESINSAGNFSRDTDGEFYDYGAANSMAIVKSVTEWTLLSNDECFHPGKPHKKHEPLGISMRNVALLDKTIRDVIKDRLGAAAELFNGGLPKASEEPAALPNGSGARSRASSRASASPTPTTPLPA